MNRVIASTDRSPVRWLAVLSLIGCLALVPAGVAHADCNNPGDFGAGSGCPPPGDDSSGGGGTESWPPTSVDWPPQFESALGGDTDKDKAPPIVTPNGMTPKAPSNASAPTPIVGAGSSTSTSTSATSTPIVMPGS